MSINNIVITNNIWPNKVNQNFISNFLSQPNQRWILHVLFLRIPKNASSSMMKLLGNYNLIKKHEQKFTSQADSKIYKGWFDPTHATQEEVYKVLRGDAQKSFSFCIVRNPWSRAVSMYHFSKKMKLNHLYGIHENISFNEFVEIMNDFRLNKHFIATFPQTKWTKGPIQLDEILKFETLSSDYKKMREKYSLFHLAENVPHENSTEHDVYQKYYDSHTKKMVELIFEEDVDEFKYLF